MDKELHLTVTPSPHLRSPVTVSRAMRDVIIALIPVTLVSIYWFKFNAIFLLLVCLGTAALTEVLFRKVMKKPVTLYDGSAMVTGLLVALCFGTGTPWWTAALATFIGVGLAKEFMGGLGWNRFNPALFGRLAVILLIPVFRYVTEAFNQLRPYLGSIDTYSQATPLALLKQGILAEMPSLGSLFIAHPGGALGETSALALLLGGGYLLYKKHIIWQTPVAIIGTVVVMSLLFGQNPLYHVLAGGVLLGAFFMATDWVTSPITPNGKIIFGVCIGVLLMLFRGALAPTEGMAFSILFMNAFVPYIDRLTKRPTFGEVPSKSKTVATPVKPSVKSS